MSNIKQLNTTSKSELAAFYGISVKQLKRRCHRAGVDLGDERILLAKKVKEIVRAIGHWTIDHEEE